ncbi:zinc finger CCCH domain protein [Perilla frutescens var. frutescens]|nr:zinc finger CCCH domain protein [Perilla frutescens var. frutescens]
MLSSSVFKLCCCKPNFDRSCPDLRHLRHRPMGAPAGRGVTGIADPAGRTAKVTAAMTFELGDDRKGGGRRWVAGGGDSGQRTVIEIWAGAAAAAMMAGDDAKKKIETMARTATVKSIWVRLQTLMKYSISVVADKGLKKSLFTSARLKKGEVLYVDSFSQLENLTNNVHSTNGEQSAVDGESSVDIFRWSHCKRPLPQKSMLGIGIPLPLEHVEVLEDNIEWDDMSWSQTCVWIAGREYHLARAHFLSQN